MDSELPHTCISATQYDQGLEELATYALSDAGTEEPTTQPQVPASDKRAKTDRRHQHKNAKVKKLELIAQLASGKVLLRGTTRFAPHWIGIRFLERVVSVCESVSKLTSSSEKGGLKKDRPRLVIDTDANLDADRLLRYTATAAAIGLEDGTLRYLSLPDTLPDHVRPVRTTSGDLGIPYEIGESRDTCQSSVFPKQTNRGMTVLDEELGETQYQGMSSFQVDLTDLTDRIQGSADGSMKEAVSGARSRARLAMDEEDDLEHKRLLGKLPSRERTRALKRLGNRRERAKQARDCADSDRRSAKELGLTVDRCRQRLQTAEICHQLDTMVQ